MKVLAIIETNITDPSWIADYTKNVTPMVLEHGGVYLTRSSNVDVLEGDEPPHFSIVAEFPSKEMALKFYRSKAYEPYKNARLAGSKSKFLLAAVENGAA